MPHLVLPLSGCLNRRTPTRATRGEARGHRSVLAHNLLLTYPPFFFSLWACRLSGVSPTDGGLAQMCLLCCGSIPAGCRSIASLCGHVGRRRAHSAIVRVVCVCCLFIASRCGVAVFMGTMTLRGRGWQSRSSGPLWLPQPVGRVWETEDTVR